MSAVNQIAIASVRFAERLIAFAHATIATRQSVSVMTLVNRVTNIVLAVNSSSAIVVVVTATIKLPLTYRELCKPLVQLRQEEAG